MPEIMLARGGVAEAGGADLPNKAADALNTMFGDYYTMPAISQAIYVGRGVSLLNTGDTPLLKVGNWNLAVPSYVSNGTAATLLALLVWKSLTGTLTTGPTVGGIYTGAGASGTNLGVTNSIATTGPALNTALRFLGAAITLTNFPVLNGATQPQLYFNVSSAPVGATALTADVFLFGTVVD